MVLRWIFKTDSPLSSLPRIRTRNGKRSVRRCCRLDWEVTEKTRSSRQICWSQTVGLFNTIFLISAFPCVCICRKVYTQFIEKEYFKHVRHIFMIAPCILINQCLLLHEHLHKKYYKIKPKHVAAILILILIFQYFVSRCCCNNKQWCQAYFLL